MIVDTLSRTLHGDQNDVSVMTPALGPLQQAALAAKSQLMFLDHHRKGSASEPLGPITDLLGSTGKAAVADTLMGLYKKAGTLGLMAEGRDLGLQEIALERQGAIWVPRVDGRDAEHDRASSDFLSALESLGGEANYKDLAEKIGKSRQAAVDTAKQLAGEAALVIDQSSPPHIVRLTP